MAEGDLTGILNTQQPAVPLWGWFVYLLCSEPECTGYGLQSKGPVRCGRLKSPYATLASRVTSKTPRLHLNLPTSHIAMNSDARTLLFTKDWRQILHPQRAVVLMTLHDPPKENSLTTASLRLQQGFSFLSQFLKQKPCWTSWRPFVSLPVTTSQQGD